MHNIMLTITWHILSLWFYDYVCVSYTAHLIIPSSMTTLELHHFSHVVNDTN